MISKCMYATQKRWKNVRILLKGLENTYVCNFVLINTQGYTANVVLFLTYLVSQEMTSYADKITAST